MKIYTKKLARLRDRARSVATRLEKRAVEMDSLDELPPAVLDLLWEEGFMTMAAPKERGGGGSPLTETSVVVEELARGSGAAALVVTLQALAMNALSVKSDLKKTAELFEQTVDRRLIFAFALSEPEPEEGGESGLTTAVKQKGEFSISGRKTFVSGAREADQVIVFAVTDKKARLKKALSAFVVPAGTTGMIPGHELSRAGLRGVPAVDLVFNGCRVAPKTMLGRRGEGYDISGKALVRTAPLAASLACGLLGRALGEALTLAGKRDRGSYTLSESQPVELTLSEAAASLDSARAFAWAAAGAVDEGMPEAERLARESKWVATEAAVARIDDLSRLFGIEANVRGRTLERLSRDARAAQLVLGPNHIHRIEVARKLLSGK